MLRASSNLALKTLKDWDCTASLSDLFLCWTLFVGEKFEAFPNTQFASCLFQLTPIAPLC